MSKYNVPILPVQYTQEEIDFRSDIIEKMERAREIRNQEHPEFDDMDYLTYYEKNAKAGNGYIQPKTNKQEVRITSGITREKKNTLLANILNLNLEPNILAIDDENLPLTEFSRTIETLEKKSRNGEKPNFQNQWIYILNEFLDQGTVAAKDSYVEFSLPDKEAKNFNFDDLKKLDWTTKIQKKYSCFQTQLISGPNIYLGNFRQPHIQLQPYVITRRLIPRPEAQAIYGKWERWKNVPDQLSHYSESDTSIPYNDWTLENYEKGFVEELEFFDKWSNNYMILLNGVLMFPVRKIDGILSTFPLSSINGACEYPIAWGVLEPIENCAYGRSIPAKTKTDQALFDEFLRLIVLKTRQSFQPPMANKSSTQLSEAVFYPGVITSGLDPEKIKPMIAATGPTSAEFSALKLIKSIIDEKSVSSIFEGNTGTGQQTATEIATLQRQSMIKLGLAIYSVVNLRHDMTYLRILNILKNWAVEGNVIEADSGFLEGGKGNLRVKFTSELPESEQILAEERLLSFVRGKKTRTNYIDPKIIKAIDFSWEIEIVPTPKDTNLIKRSMFEESVVKAATIFEPRGVTPNWDYLAERWAIMADEDPERFWIDKTEQQEQGQRAMMGGALGQTPPTNLQGLSPVNNQPKLTPSINTLAGQAE